MNLIMLTYIEILMQIELHVMLKKVSFLCVLNKSLNLDPLKSTLVTFYVEIYFLFR